MHTEHSQDQALDQTQDHALLDTWRKQGHDRANPLAFHYMSALQNRLRSHQGPARQALENKLSGLIAAYAERLQQRPPTTVNAQATTTPATPVRGMLAELADTLANRATRHAADTAAAATGNAAAPVHGGSSNDGTMERMPNASMLNHSTAIDTGAPASPLPELEALAELRQLWSSVRSESQIKRSLQNSPANAGPLNSSSLVHRSLNLMREVSPGYLQQFLSYVDVLAGLEQMKDGGALGDKSAPAVPGHKTRTRAKPRKRQG